MTTDTTTNRTNAIEPAKARAPESKAAVAPQEGPRPAPAQRRQVKGPSASRNLAAAGATARGVGLVAAMAAGAQQGAPAPPRNPAGS